MDRRLVEAFPSSGLKVDRESGVIYGVRILGPQSLNTYGVPGVDATEYAQSAHDDARSMYEGMPVRLNHQREPNKERRVEEKFGKLSNARTELTPDGPVTYADLHYLKSDPMALKLAEDVERKLGMYGFSHDAYAGKERVDKQRKKLVIESLRKVNSVDLVDTPATNRNLWESVTPAPTSTLRQLIDGLKDLPPGKAAWVRRLTEDQAMAMPMAVEFGASAESDAEAQMAAAFRAAILAVLDDEGMTLDAKKSKIGMLLTVQDKLASGEDPAAPEETEMATPETPKTESVDPAEYARLKAENEALKADAAVTAAVRQLCESAKFTPSDVQLTALKALPDDKTRRALIESFKPEVQPRSGYTGGAKTEAEHKPAPDAKSFAQRLLTK